MRMIIMTSLAAVFAAPSLAADNPPGRYSLLSVDGGFVRLDTTTGDMVSCTNLGGTFSCSPLAVTRTETKEQAPASETERIAKLEQRLDMLEERSLTVPDSEDLDKALSAMEKFMRRFMDMAREEQDKTAL